MKNTHAQDVLHHERWKLERDIEAWKATLDQDGAFGQHKVAQLEADLESVLGALKALG
jgi:hypothetical protein